jgi:hypothetical protein
MGASDDSGARLANRDVGGSGGNVVSLHQDAGRTGKTVAGNCRGRNENHVRFPGQVQAMKALLRWYQRNFKLSDETQKACKAHHDTWCRVQQVVGKDDLKKFKEQGV